MESTKSSKNFFDDRFSFVQDIYPQLENLYWLKYRESAYSDVQNRGKYGIVLKSESEKLDEIFIISDLNSFGENLTKIYFYILRKFNSKKQKFFL